jgi:hypothetical protein
MARTNLALMLSAITLGVVSLLPAAAVAQPGDQARVLVYSKTAAFRHGSIPTGIAAIQQLGQQNGFRVDATEDSAQFTDANLARYDAVVWLSTTGDVLNDEQQAAFERYIQGGGGYVGIHSARTPSTTGRGTADSAWCHAYDGGRAWYTALGHTNQSYSEPLFRQHILGGIRWAAGNSGGDCGGTDWEHYSKTTLDPNARFPSEIEVAPDGRVFYIEMGERRQLSTPAALKVIDPETNTTSVVDTLDVFTGIATGRRTGSSAWRWTRASPGTGCCTCTTPPPKPAGRARRLTRREARAA